MNLYNPVLSQAFLTMCKEVKFNFEQNGYRSEANFNNISFDVNIICKSLNLNHLYAFSKNTVDPQGLRGQNNFHTYVREEPAVSCRWNGWVQEIISWSSKLQEVYRSF